MTSTDERREGLPPGWVSEEESDDVYSWLGPAEHVVFKRDVTDSGKWTAYAQPRGELAEPVRTPLVEDAVDFEEALSTVRQYMQRNEAVE